MTKDKILSQVSELVSDGARVGTRASKAHSPVSWLWLDRRELRVKSLRKPDPLRWRPQILLTHGSNAFLLR